MDKPRVVILGAGVGGLAAGYFLARTGKFRVSVLERAGHVGGLCSSFEHRGFVLDHGPHRIYSVIPGIMEEVEQLLGPDLLKVTKKNSLFLDGHLIDYPLRMGNLARALGPGRFLKLGLGYGASLTHGLVNGKPAGSYEQYMIQRFGRPAYELVFQPLADKVWGDPATLHPEMARARVPAANGMEVILKLTGIKKETRETNIEWYYYPRKGFGQWPESLRRGIERAGGEIHVRADVQSLQLDGLRVTGVAGQVDGQPAAFPCEYLVSSIPLPLLGRLAFRDADPELNRALTDLQFRHLILVYLFLRRPQILRDQWMYFPDRSFLFGRIFEQKQMNPESGPPDRTAICCDFTCDEDSWQWRAGDEELAARCAADLVRAGFITAGDVEGQLVKRQRSFYPRYDLDYVAKLGVINEKLKQLGNVMLTGRIGMYNYNNSDHCADMGRFIAERLAEGDPPPDVWRSLEQRVKTYKIID